MIKTLSTTIVSIFILLANVTATGNVVGLYFDGNNDYYEVANESNFDFNYNSRKSFSFWFYCNLSNSNFVVILDKLSAEASPTGYLVGVFNCEGGEANMIYLEYSGSTSIGRKMLSFGDTDILTLRGWHHFVVVVDGSGVSSNAKFYLDGKQDTTKVYTGYESNATSCLNNLPVWIGIRRDTANDLFGVLDNFVVFNRTIGFPEIQELYTKTWRGRSDGVVAIWNYDNFYSDGMICDDSGNGNHSTFISGTTLTIGADGVKR